MRQTLMTVSLQLAFALGIRENAWKLSNKLPRGTGEMVLMSASAIITPSIAMMELAEEMAMNKPNDHIKAIYHNYADWFGHYIRENEKLPLDSEKLTTIKDLILNVFDEMLSRTQKDSLADKLMAFVKQAKKAEG